LAAADDLDRESAEEHILRVTAFLSSLPAAEKGDGRCMPTTLLLQRFLDEEGIWNFPQKGGMVVQFPGESMLRPKLLPPQSVSGGTYGHAWTVAPPFRVIDLTITRQFYTPAEQAYISGNLLAKHVAVETEHVFWNTANRARRFDISSLLSPRPLARAPSAITPTEPAVRPRPLPK
jgi:hypothetical protein